MKFQQEVLVYWTDEMLCWNISVFK